MTTDLSNNVQASIDQLTLSLPNVNGVEQFELAQTIIDKLKLKRRLGEPNLCKPRNRTYNMALGWGENYSNIQIMWRDGTEEFDIKQGILLYFDATGKRLFEDNTPFEQLLMCWPELIEKVYELGGHLTRIDIAIDIFNADVNLSKTYDDARNGRLVIKNRNNKPVSIGQFSKDFVTTGMTINSRSSDAFGRLYDKKREQTDKQGPFYQLALESNSWVRIEGEFKHKLAEKIGKEIIQCTDIETLDKFLVAQIVDRWQLVDGEELIELWRQLTELSEPNMIVVNSNIQLPSLVKSLHYFITFGGAGLLYKVYRIFGEAGLAELNELLNEYFRRAHEFDGFQPSKNAPYEIRKIRQEAVNRNLGIIDYWNQATGLIAKEKGITGNFGEYSDSDKNEEFEKHSYDDDNVL